MRRRVAYPLLLFLLLSPGSAFPGPAAPDGAGYQDELLDAARRLGLSGERYWDVLLHYKGGPGQRRSLVDDPRFFLSPRGKADPEAELEAAVSGFFEAGGEEKETPRCRFPARYAWLSERLAVDPARIPPVSCPSLDWKTARIDARRASLVFATGHLNSPASMYGHTFLRIDPAYESPLLAHAVNYAATTDPRDGGFTYAFKGIFGLYPGYYSILPYYDKVKEYHGMDQRDLWEYPLRLSPEQVRRMTLHVLDLQEIGSDYYFFGENCSYNLLFLLEAAAPEASLTERFGPWTIPADTVKAVKEAGLLESPAYRPSQVRQIRALAESLGDEGAGRAAAVADGALPPSEAAADGASPGERARALDAAAETVQLRYMKRQLSEEAFRKRYLPILAERSRIAGAGTERPAVPRPAPPDRGHGSSRASLGGGVRGDDAFVEAGYRPAYHELLDDGDGYTEGSEIDFLNLAVRWWLEEDRVRLHRLDLVRIVSLAPRDRFFRPVSWKVLASVRDREFRDDRREAAFVLNPGGGFAWSPWEGSLLSALLETEAAASEGYDDGYAVAAGISGVAAIRLSRPLRLLLEARRTFGFLGDTRQGSRFDAAARLGVRLGQDLSLFLEGEREDAEGIHEFEGKATVNLYF